LTMNLQVEQRAKRERERERLIERTQNLENPMSQTRRHKTRK
jgi:hypothetical protein